MLRHRDLALSALLGFIQNGFAIPPAPASGFACSASSGKRRIAAARSALSPSPLFLLSPLFLFLLSPWH